MNTLYDLHSDEVIQALIAEAAADPDVIGLVLTGSRAVGAVAPESDYDVVFVVTEEAITRYERTQPTPMRGTSIIPAIDTSDIWHAAPSELRLDTIELWMLPAWAESRLLYDRTGETAQAIEALRRMPEAQAQAETTTWYDAYLNGLYRSLKAWRRGNTLGARMEAAETAGHLLHLLFALERHWRPYSSRLPFHLDKLAGQGWHPGELQDILLDLITTGNPRHQQAVAWRVATLLRERGFGHVYDDWEGKIDQVLTWSFSE